MMSKFFINICLGFVKLTGLLPVLIFFKPKILKLNKKQKLPKGCIIVSNHKSLLDFPFYLLVFPFRTIRFLMAEVLYNKSKFFGFFLNAIGGIKVERNSKDFSFVANALEVLDKKGTVGIFPEGRLPVNGKPFPFTVSTAYIAINSAAPIVPVFTDGNYGISKRASVVIGEPFYLTDYCKEDLTETEQLNHLTETLENKVRGLEEFLRKDEK